jgi:hypothetical protein
MLAHALAILRLAVDLVGIVFGHVHVKANAQRLRRGHASLERLRPDRGKRAGRRLPQRRIDRAAGCLAKRALSDAGLRAFGSLRSVTRALHTRRPDCAIASAQMSSEPSIKPGLA